MKYLSLICLLLWLVPYLGKELAPEVFYVWYLQLAPFLLLSILVPLGFARSIRMAVEKKLNYKECGHSFLFLFIFLTSNFLMGFGFNLQQTIPHLLAATSISMPENLALNAVNSEKFEVRKLVASVVYSEFGQPIIYKDESNQLVMYAPTAEEKQKYKLNEMTASKIKDLVSQTKTKALEIMYLQIWSMLSFFFIFSCTFWLEQKKRRSQSSEISDN